VTRPFADHFSRIARGYAAYRPGYPAELFAWLATLPSARDVAWDCAAGNGQASLPLAAHFRRVVATDASADQLAAAPPHPGVTYRVAPAAASGLADRSVDLVTVAQALHWIEPAPFYAEVRRVVRSGGAVAAWTYNLLETGDPAIDRMIRHFHDDVVGPWWAPERRHVVEGYRTLDFPFDETAAPKFEMRTLWTLPELLGYLGTWSAAVKYAEARGRDAVEGIAADLVRHWGDGARPVAWPLAVRAGRIG